MRTLFKKVIVILCLSMALPSMPAYANFYIGGTRLVYNANAKSAAINVGNKSSQVVYLVQSWVDSDDKTNAKKQFIVTPPLFRLNENEDNILRIIFTGDPTTVANDRETLYWLNIKAIPGEKVDTKNKLSLSFLNKIKLFYRPAELQKNASTAYQSIKFIQQDHSLTVSNPTGYYITFFSINSEHGKIIKEPVMIEPFGNVVLPLTKKINKVSWITINDFGGKTPIKTQSF